MILRTYEKASSRCRLGACALFSVGYFAITARTREDPSVLVKAAKVLDVRKGSYLADGAI
jgi:hypothetical protein